MLSNALFGFSAYETKCTHIIISKLLGAEYQTPTNFRCYAKYDCQGIPFVWDAKGSSLAFERYAHIADGAPDHIGPELDRGWFHPLCWMEGGLLPEPHAIIIIVVVAAVSFGS